MSYGQNNYCLLLILKRLREKMSRQGQNIGSTKIMMDPCRQVRNGQFKRPFRPYGTDLYSLVSTNISSRWDVQGVIDCNLRRVGGGAFAEVFCRFSLLKT